MDCVKKRDSIIVSDNIENAIFFIRGQKVMIDTDIARLYGVPTKALNQAVKRNRNRFPEDFVFLLSDSEKHELVTNCDHFQSCDSLIDSLMLSRNRALLCCLRY